MNVTLKKAPSKEGQFALEALQSAVKKALERKKRLGQYAIVWHDGKPVIIGEDAPEDTE
ncbi:hypothetical protein Gbem_0768 [Citrifermentans bemidjiense Bem]|uniref:Uncharacterized protein n=1 Tax=Citrifermentans bemidjiense (strain ATCC BAA-1014 / DSM 16622 / JCM 12645 / Bem) TaxID=404380 RepID=B5EE56_CITBB|nr:hypothetical protein [Citrifermentans bemidjiense]ACH37794.1 hypothetical protein Gbem_0768 [Citrifermentans bemidjiense Bem]